MELRWFGWKVAPLRSWTQVHASNYILGVSGGCTCFRPGSTPDANFGFDLPVVTADNEYIQWHYKRLFPCGDSRVIWMKMLAP